MAKLIIKLPDGHEFTHELKDDVTTIGRSSTNIIQISDEQASREHCRIMKEGGNFRIEDLKSRNGVYVNEAKVELQTLKVGDVIRVGEHKFVFDQEVKVTAEELGATVPVNTLTEKDLRPEPAPAAAKAPEGPPRYVLLVTGGLDKGKSVNVEEKKVTIGRHASNAMPLQDEASSNYHAEISKEAIGYVLTDLGSTNGTKVNGEKIVKSPLAHGTEITIGQTTMVFKDVTRQVDEDHVFGTVVLDTEQLEKELAQAGAGGPSRVGAIAAVVVMVAVLGGLGYGVYRGVQALFSPSFGPPSGSLITANFSFDGDTDPTGAPRGWEWDASRSLIWSVDAGEDSIPENSQKGALVLKRLQDSLPDAYTECRYTDMLSVDPGKLLEVSVRARSLGATGSFGIAVHWLGGEGLEDIDYVSFWGTQQQWKELKGELVSPAWAKSARFALYAIGNQGTVYFDQAAAIPGGLLTDTREIAVESSGVNVSVNPVGKAWLRLRGILAVPGIEVVTVAGNNVESLQRFARAGTRHKEGEQVIAGGDFVEYASLDWVHYNEKFYQSRYGVGITCDVSSRGDIGVDEVALRFEVGGQFGLDLPRLYGETAAIDYKPRKIVEGVREVTFTGVRGDSFSFFSPEKDVSAKIAKKGRSISVDFIIATKGVLGPEPLSITIEANDRSVREEMRLSMLREALDKAMAEGPASAVYEALDKLTAELGERPDVKELVEARRKALSAQLETVKTGLNKVITDLKSATGPDSRAAAKEQADAFITKNADFWKGTEGYAVFEEALNTVKASVESWAGEEMGKKADDLLKKAYATMDAKAYPIALSYVETILKDHPNSAAAKKVTDSNLKKVIEDAIARKAREKTFVDRVMSRIQNYELNKRYDDAIRIITTDPDYPVFPDNETIKAKLEDLRAKASAAPTPAPAPETPPKK